MSKITITLRVWGNLPPSEKLTHNLGILPTEVLRRGERVSKKRVQPVDMWRLELANFETDTTTEEIDNQMQRATVTLNKMAPALRMLDRANCNADLYISTIREEDQGGFSIPAELVAAAASGKLSIETSILIMLDDYEEPQQKSELSISAHQKMSTL
jgi:hypothetical protein